MRRSLQEKLELLKNAEAFRNVSRFCREQRLSRSHFYELRKAFLRQGVDGLKPRVRKIPRMPNAFPAEVILMILRITEKFPSYSAERISRKLTQIGIKASGSGVWKVWKRHGRKEMKSGLAICQPRS